MNKYHITIEEAITYQNYFDKLKECNTNVGFKLSVQEYNVLCVYKITQTIRKILAGKIPEVRDTKLVCIYERGKKRIITPIDIADRVTQKVLCDYVLIPSIAPQLIYDNGASMKDKGTDFARKRLNLFLEKAKREYGTEQLYAFVFDFKNYFDSIPHKECYRVLKEYLTDERLVNLIIGIIESYQLGEIKSIEDNVERENELNKLKRHERVGICLGSQISQIMAVAVPNKFDHYIKDYLGMKYYVRYMDDGVILFNDKEKLVKLKSQLQKVAEKYGLHFNAKKTRVVKLSKGFTFLKTKYRVNDRSQTIKVLTHAGIVRERRRLKKFVSKVAEEKMTLDDIYNNIQSWNAHAKIAQSFHTQKSMFALYDRLYGGYRMTRKYFKEHPENKRGRRVLRI